MSTTHSMYQRRLAAPPLRRDGRRRGRRCKDSVKAGMHRLVGEARPRHASGAAVKPVLALLATLAVAAVPSSASAVGTAPHATLTVVEVPVHDQRTLASARPPARFGSAGLHWQGRGSLRRRPQRAGGAWGRWHDAAPEPEDRPDAGSAESRGSAGWRLGSPWWTGASDRIEYRLHGDVRRLRAYLVTSPRIAGPTRMLASAGSP